MKIFYWYLIAVLVGVLTYLLGFPFIVNETISFKAVGIMVILDTIFGILFFAKD